MSTIFRDNCISSSEIRAFNVATLKSAGFIPGGLFSRSGEMLLVEKKSKFQLVFGVRSNISGARGRKYFSLSKDFTHREHAEAFAKTLQLKSNVHQ